MVRPGVRDLFFGRVVVLHGPPKDLPALGDQDLTICTQQLDIRHRSIVEHGCFLFLERRPPFPTGSGMTQRLTVGCARSRSRVTRRPSFSLLSALVIAVVPAGA